ncbi:hypothetical protein [Paenibacillus contaminans]|uniref:MucB/RseB N-terminal domain-containing protein n=1 Tax=Paenibacillus contaminans TaxID=450362 RepID=A0A329LUX6_9BACL|nr:hypothetical protein [Paenibacillus contaminans]RAV11504.1 hypothetical protein DQG23_36290 [Paenibacillus contaminans]
MKPNEYPWYDRLKDGPFGRERKPTERQLLEIEKRIASRSGGRRRRPAFLPIAACVIILATGVGLFTVHKQYGKFEIGKSDGRSIVSGHGSRPLEVTRQPSSHNKYPSYSTIEDRMLNSIDNFNTVKGSYRQFEHGVTQEVEFEIAEGDSPGSYVRVKKTDSSEYTEWVSDGQYVLQLDSQKKEYIRHLSGGPPVKPEGPRYYKDERGNNNWVGRGDPARTSVAKEVILPSNFTFWMIDADTLQPTYSITGTETFLGRNAVILEGALGDYIGSKFKATGYKYWIDSETGILLKLQLTDDQNQIPFSIEMQSIEIDIGVDRTKFSTEEPVGWEDKSSGRGAVQIDGS